MQLDGGFTTSNTNYNSYTHERSSPPVCRGKLPPKGSTSLTIPGSVLYGLYILPRDGCFYSMFSHRQLRCLIAHRSSSSNGTSPALDSNDRILGPLLCQLQGCVLSCSHQVDDKTSPPAWSPLCFSSVECSATRPLRSRVTIPKGLSLRRIDVVSMACEACEVVDVCVNKNTSTRTFIQYTLDLEDDPMDPEYTTGW